MCYLFVGDTFVVEIEFDEDNSTALYISFTPTAGNQKVHV